MYRPQARNVKQRLLHAMKGGSARRDYWQDLSEAFCNDTESVFRTVNLEYFPEQMTYVFLGENTKTASPAERSVQGVMRYHQVAPLSMYITKP